MIYIGENEITNIMIGDTEIYGIYAGDLQIYPTDFGTLTGITLEDLVWETNVPYMGGTATSANCSFNVFAHYDSGKTKRVTRYAEVSGSLVVPETTATTIEPVGTLYLTASYEGFTDTQGVTVYQNQKTYNNILVYTTTDNQQLVLPADFASLGWSQNYVSHSFSDGSGLIYFDNDLTSIAPSAFSGQTTLSTIAIPSTVTSYGTKAFYNCSGVTKINIPSGVTSIGTECFHMTSGELTIESQYAVEGSGKASGTGDYTDSGTYGFNYRFCSTNTNDMAYMNFDKIIVTGDSITYIGKAAFHTSPATEFVFGDNVTSFGGMALARMQSQRTIKHCQKVTFGNNVTLFGAYLFFVGAGYVTEIYCHTPTRPTIGSGYVFSYMNSNNGTFHYPSNGTGYTPSAFDLSKWTFVNDL